MKRVLLYFGSFNPVHRGHIALAEYAIAQDIADQVILIVSPQNPHKQSADLAPEFSRYEMCSAACQASKYPEQILVSAVEFTLSRPSYTIDTLQFLTDNFGSQMRFSILMGADNIARFDTWKEYEKILASYPIFVYIILYNIMKYFLFTHGKSMLFSIDLPCFFIFSKKFEKVCRKHEGAFVFGW